MFKKLSGASDQTQVGSIPYTPIRTPLVYKITLKIHQVEDLILKHKVCHYFWNSNLFCSTGNEHTHLLNVNKEQIIENNFKCQSNYLKEKTKTSKQVTTFPESTYKLTHICRRINFNECKKKPTSFTKYFKCQLL